MRLTFQQPIGSFACTLSERWRTQKMATRCKPSCELLTPQRLIVSNCLMTLAKCSPAALIWRGDTWYIGGRDECARHSNRFKLEMKVCRWVPEAMFQRAEGGCLHPYLHASFTYSKLFNGERRRGLAPPSIFCARYGCISPRLLLLEVAEDRAAGRGEWWRWMDGWMVEVTSSVVDPAARSGAMNRTGRSDPPSIRVLVFCRHARKETGLNVKLIWHFSSRRFFKGLLGV